MHTKILVISPHPDDEVLGLGGYLLSLNKNYKVHIVCFVNNNPKRTDEFDFVIEFLNRHSKAKFTGKILLDCLNLEFNNTKYPLDGNLSIVPPRLLTSYLDNVLKSFEPHILFIPAPSFHKDHTTVFEICKSSTRPKNSLKNLKQIYSYENPASIWSLGRDLFFPNSYFDISSKIDLKLELLNIYQSQFNNNNFINVESVKQWARIRSIEARNSNGYAEAFNLLFNIL